MAHCYDCDRPYGDPGFPDMLVPDDVWRQISPDGEGNGLLCPSCICGRVHTLGIEEVPHSFTSGPFRTEWGRVIGGVLNTH